MSSADEYWKRVSVAVAESAAVTTSITISRDDTQSAVITDTDFVAIKISVSPASRRNTTAPKEPERLENGLGKSGPIIRTYDFALNR